MYNNEIAAVSKNTMSTPQNKIDNVTAQTKITDIVKRLSNKPPVTKKENNKYKAIEVSCNKERHFSACRLLEAMTSRREKTLVV